MAKSLAQWCKENDKPDILSELDCDKNSEWCSGERIEYNSPRQLNWKCKKGHEYQCEVVGRTLFGLKCPICYPNGSTLPIGTKYGCLTIIDNSNNHKIKCQCKCGEIFHLSQLSFLASRHRYCTSAVTMKDLENRRWEMGYYNTEPRSEEDVLREYCGLAVKAWRKKNKADSIEYARNYFTDFEGTTFESLKILECIDDNRMELHKRGDLRTNNSCHRVIYKIYKYRCYLCGNEGTVKCSELNIDRCPSRYYYKFHCHCHEPSLFEWVVNKVLIENKVPYEVEYSFADLLGRCNMKQLKFDFAVFNKDGSVKCLIECQGQQHNKPVEIFGGERTFKGQKENDSLKREYVKKHDIQLIEIPYKDRQYNKIETILKQHNII